MIHLCPKCGDLTPGEWHDDLYWDCVNYGQDVTWAWCSKCQASAGIEISVPARGSKPPGSGRIFNFQREVIKQRRCGWCDQTYVAHTRNRKYCSETCKLRAAYQRTKRWRAAHPTQPGRPGRPGRQKRVEV